MRTALAAVFLVACSVAFAQNPASRLATSDNAAAPKSVVRVFLTHRKFWLASGGFSPNHQTKVKPTEAPDFRKDFEKRCPQVEITDMAATANYAVTIDEIGTLEALAGTNAPAFQVSVYGRSTGLLYMGGTNFLKNAVKDACNSIGAKER